MNQVCLKSNSVIHYLEWKRPDHLSSYGEEIAWNKQIKNLRRIQPRERRQRKKRPLPWRNALPWRRWFRRYPGDISNDRSITMVNNSTETKETLSGYLRISKLYNVINMDWFPESQGLWHVSTQSERDKTRLYTERLNEQAIHGWGYEGRKYALPPNRIDMKSKPQSTAYSSFRSKADKDRQTDRQTDKVAFRWLESSIKMIVKRISGGLESTKEGKGKPGNQIYVIYGFRIWTDEVESIQRRSYIYQQLQQIKKRQLTPAFRL